MQALDLSEIIEQPGCLESFAFTDLLVAAFASIYQQNLFHHKNFAFNRDS